MNKTKRTISCGDAHRVRSMVTRKKKKTERGKYETAIAEKEGPFKNDLSKG